MSEPARLFIGLWPSEDVRDAVWRHAQAWSWPRTASRVRREKLHMTLHFLGELPRERVAGVAQGLEVPVEPFELVLDRGEVWHGGIAVLRTAATPPGLRDLHERLTHVLARLELSPARSQLKPHVTLARRAQGAVAPACEPMGWSVDSFVLIESDLRPPGAYRIVRRFA
jgi:2'-5' RNA ligase